MKSQWKYGHFAKAAMEKVKQEVTYVRALEEYAVERKQHSYGQLRLPLRLVFEVLDSKESAR
jgi:hypothetical protein